MKLKKMALTIFPFVSHDQPDIDEGGLRNYQKLKWYSAKPGKLLQDGYSIATKLGYGTTSTVWLVLDWTRKSYAVTKIHVANDPSALQETKVLDKLKGITSGHPGANLIRNYLNTCQVRSDILSKHKCIIYPPLGPSLREVRKYHEGCIPPLIFKPMIKHMLLALDYLHTECRMVHTDIHCGNFLIQLADNESLDRLRTMETSNPSVPYTKGRYTIYKARRFPTESVVNVSVLCDLAAAVSGDQHTGDPTPDLMRPPEIILQIPWSNKIDIWCLGLVIWHCIQGRQWYQYKYAPRGLTELEHMAGTVALLGNPPQTRLAWMGASKRRAKFFNSNGQFLYPSIVPRLTMMDRELVFAADHEERKQFVLFLSRMLQWNPESRSSAAELLQDPWIN